MTLPPNVSVLICRKRAEELVGKKQWDDVCKFLDPTFKADYPDGIGSLMPTGPETTLTADLLEFSDWLPPRLCYQSLHATNSRQDGRGEEPAASRWH